MRGTLNELDYRERFKDDNRKRIPLRTFQSAVKFPEALALRITHRGVGVTVILPGMKRVRGSRDLSYCEAEVVEVPGKKLHLVYDKHAEAVYVID